MKRRTRKRTCPALVRRARRRGYTCHPPALPPAHPLPQPPTQPPTWQATGPASQSHHHPHAAAAAPTTDGDQERAVRARGACAQCGWERGVHRHEGAGAGERDAVQCTARGRARECNHPTHAGGWGGRERGEGGEGRMVAGGGCGEAAAWGSVGRGRPRAGVRLWGWRRRCARAAVRQCSRPRPTTLWLWLWLGAPLPSATLWPSFWARPWCGSNIFAATCCRRRRRPPPPRPPPPHPPPRKYFIVPALVRWEVVAAHTPRRGLADALRG